MSGYAEEAFRRNDEKAEDLHFLPKPFGLKQLAAKVKEVLSSAPPPAARVGLSRRIEDGSLRLDSDAPAPSTTTSSGCELGLHARILRGPFAVFRCTRTMRKRITLYYSNKQHLQTPCKREQNMHISVIAAPAAVE